MPSTNFPNGVNATTSVRTVAGELYGTTLTVTSTATFSGGATITGAGSFSGAVSGATGSVYGGRSNLVALGSQTVTLTSALYVTTALLAPFTGVVELVYFQDATASITRSIRIVGGVDSTGTAITTLTLGSATTQASTLYTTIGGTVINQGSQFVITSAVTATANTGYLTCNMIALAS